MKEKQRRFYQFNIFLQFICFCSPQETMSDFWKQMEKDVKSQVKTSPIECNEIPGCLTGKADECGPVITTTAAPICHENSSIWSSWKNINECKEKCGSCDFVDQERTCLTPKCPCEGDSTRVIRCGTYPCFYPRLSCCDGMSLQVLDGRALCGFPKRSDTKINPELVASCEGTWKTWRTWTDEQSNDSGCIDGRVTQYRDCQPETCYCRGNRTRESSCHMNNGQIIFD